MRKLACLFVVGHKPLDFVFSELQSPLCGHVVSVNFEVLHDDDASLNKCGKICRNVASDLVLFHDDAEAFSSDCANVRNSIRVSQHQSNHTGTQSLLAKFDDKLFNDVGIVSHPTRFGFFLRLFAAAFSLFLGIESCHG